MEFFSATKYEVTIEAGREGLLLPPYKGSTLRGGFGSAFRRIACSQQRVECRDCLLDRVVVALINKGFLIKMEDGLLSVETRRQFAEKVKERLESQERYRGRRLKLRAIIQAQARRMAIFLRGENSYKPFVGGW